ncbi:MAG TPA: penicillin acylase family protein [Bryobacteraceae bacterium]|nr:penicillin acylase family protein [Bryobacteraceae bacterium]
MLFNTPLLRAINLSIAVLLVALAGAAYWFAWRPLPQTSGEIAAPIAARATVSRDALGVPHISAASWEDAIFLQGYVTAQDRMWQMDALRRLAAGELAEVIGPSALDQDRESRRLRLSRIAEAQANNLTPETKVVFAAYARGVNYYLETHRNQLPLEFTLLNYSPRPWRMEDTLLAALQMFRMLTTSWPEEIRKLHMLEKGDQGKVEFLYPARTGTEVAPGSNAWAISGAHTASGKPILAGDPHLEWSIPSPWYLVHLKGGDLDVTGASLPGIPAVIVGHNQRVAWSVTNLEFDVQDLYREQIDAGNGRYVISGQPRQAALERDWIGVKGQKPLQADTWITAHGPVFLNDEGRNYSLRWTAADAMTMEFPFLALDRARNWDEFNQTLRHYSGPAQNFVYADVDGNIGYHAAGVLPNRQGCRGDVPADGASNSCQWAGAIPYDDLPQVYNPPSGIIASANQDPFPDNYRYAVNGGFAPPYRAREIRTLLSRHDKWKPEEILGVQKDVYSSYLNFLAHQAVQAWDKHPNAGAQMRAAVETLRNWNGQTEKKTAAPMVATLLDAELRKAAANAASPGAEGEYAARMAPVVIEKLLRERPAGWFKDYDDLIVNSLSAAVSAGEKIQGSNVAEWDYGQTIELRLVHPVGGQLPLAGRYFNIGPVPMSGSSTSIKQTAQRLGPSLRMVIDLANLDQSQANIVTGESGHFLSRHYKDQWGAYYGGTSFPMQFDKVDARDTLVVNPL